MDSVSNLNCVILRIRIRNKRTGRIARVERYLHEVSLECFRQLCEDYGKWMHWNAYWEMWSFNMG